MKRGPLGKESDDAVDEYRSLDIYHPQIYLETSVLLVLFLDVMAAEVLLSFNGSRSDSS